MQRALKIVHIWTVFHEFSSYHLCLPQYFSSLRKIALYYMLIWLCVDIIFAKLIGIQWLCFCSGLYKWKTNNTPLSFAIIFTSKFPQIQLQIQIQGAKSYISKQYPEICGIKLILVMFCRVYVGKFPHILNISINGICTIFTFCRSGVIEVKFCSISWHSGWKRSVATQNIQYWFSITRIVKFVPD